MDKVRLENLESGARALGVSLPPGAAASLLWLGDELLKWNRKVNLTAVTQPDEVLEKHLLDSLTVSAAIPAQDEVLDVGCGAGFPGLPLAVIRPDVRVTLVDSVAKKLAFARAAAAHLKVPVRVHHAHVAGQPAAEGLPLADVAVSRAFREPAQWLALAVHYVKPGGRVVAMLGAEAEGEALRRAAAEVGAALEALRAFALPFSGARRAVASFHVEHSPRR